MKNQTIRIILILFIATLLWTCNKKASVIGPAGNAIKIGTKYIVPADKGSLTNVVKQANTAEVKLAVMSNFVKEEGGKLYFNVGAADVKNLKTGSVVLFEGYALRKITSIAESGGQIVVTATEAKFTEYYKSAKVNYTQKMSWTASNLRKARVNMGGRMASPTENSQTDDLEFSGTISGWEIKLTLAPDPSGAGQKLNMEFTAKKEGKGAIKTKGFISDFEADSQIDVAGGRINSMSQHNNNLNGEMEFKYTFLTLRESATFEIPIEFEQTILVEGVIPVTFKLKCVLKVFPEIAQNSTSNAHLKVTYNGRQGFSYNGGSMVPEGILSQFASEILGDTGSASAGIIGVGVGFEFPRLSVGVFGELIVPYIVHNTSVISYFESGLPFVPGPCNQTRLKIKGSIGVDLNFFGVGFSQSQDLYEREKKFEKEGSKCPATNSAKRAEMVMGLIGNL